MPRLVYKFNLICKFGNETLYAGYEMSMFHFTASQINFLHCCCCFDFACNSPSFSFHMKNVVYEGWNFNSGNYLFTTDTK